MHIKFAKLPVSDQDRAIEFYTDNFDCEVAKDESYEEGGWRWIELTFAGAQTTLQFDKCDVDEPSDQPSLVLVDAELDEAVKSLKASGVEIITEPNKAPWDSDSRFAEFRDSEGNRMVIATA